MKNSKRSVGNRYEEMASQYLLENGYEILARNVVYRCGEIDIVARQGDTLVFVEVRKRDPRSGIAPEETLTPTKQKRLLRAIRLYLARYSGTAARARIDLIGFTGEHLTHFEDFMRIQSA